MPKNDERKSIRCSFCGKHPDQVQRMIAGPGVYICNECVNLCMEAMGAENFIGWILESYIASEAEPLGWVWCSGAIVRSVDFIRPMDGGNWRMLQVKNRSNSENSSSSKVRQGTSIEKWFRIYAYNGKTNWDTFPDPELRTKLSEESFRTYIIDYFSRRP